MTYPTLLALLGIFTYSAASAIGAEEGPNVHIAHFSQDKAAAISYTLDDGLKDQADLAAPMLESQGFRGTFFIVAGVVSETDEEVNAKKPGAHGTITWKRLKELSDKGHEIANHTWTHKVMLKIDDEAGRKEIDLAYDKIKEKIGIAPLTFCFPGNGQDDRTRKLALTNHIAVRQFQRGFGKPEFTTEEANKWANGIIKSREWGVVMIHGILVGYDAFANATVLEDHLKYIKGKENEVWVDTFAHVAAYIAERDQSTVKVTARTAKSLTLTVENTLDARYDVPLTLVIEPVTATQVSAQHEGSTEKLPAKVQGNKILVDAVPSTKPIVVSWE